MIKSTAQTKLLHAMHVDIKGVKLGIWDTAGLRDDDDHDDDNDDDDD